MEGTARHLRRPSLVVVLREGSVRLGLGHVRVFSDFVMIVNDVVVAVSIVVVLLLASGERDEDEADESSREAAPSRDYESEDRLLLAVCKSVTIDSSVWLLATSARGGKPKRENVQASSKPAAFTS